MCFVFSVLSLSLSFQGDDALSEDRIELDNQLHVFEAVMNKDIAEVSSWRSKLALFDGRWMYHALPCDHGQDLSRHSSTRVVLIEP